jgi:hypothetical protein
MSVDNRLSFSILPTRLHPDCLRTLSVESRGISVPMEKPSWPWWLKPPCRLQLKPTAAEKLALDLGEGTLAYLIERARDEAFASIVSPDGTAPLGPRWMRQLAKNLRSLLVRMEKPPTSPRLGASQETAMSHDQREKLIRLLLTAEALAVDLADGALVAQIRKAIAEARAGFVRQA